MKRNFKELMRVYLLIGALFLSACGAAKQVEPMDEEQHQMHFSLGGPLITQGGINVPVPYIVAGYRYGYTERVSLHASLHPVALAFKTFAGEFGASYVVLDQESHGANLIFDGRVFFGMNTEDIAAFPLLTAIVSRRYQDFIPYLGLDAVYQFHDTDAPYTPQSYAPFLGLEYALGKHWSTGAELKWGAVNHKTDDVRVEHPSPFGLDRGFWLPYMYLSYQF